VKPTLKALSARSTRAAAAGTAETDASTEVRRSASIGPTGLSEGQFAAAVERPPPGDRAAIDDDQVMAGVKAGSVDAFGVLYDRYCDRAYRIAWSVCRDDGRAEEAVQEAFGSIWKTRATYGPQIGAVAPWVLSVVRYRAIDIARSNGRQVADRASDDVLHTIRAPDSGADEVAADAEPRDLLRLLAELPDAQREAITLAFYGHLTHSEIAAHLGLPAGTVKGRMRLGLQRLRGEMQRAVASDARRLERGL
jgi:RNA polymerase sigma-70 factor, ECF subfamily